MRIKEYKGEKMAKKKTKRKVKPLGNGQRLNGRGCRAKGHSFEREVAIQMRKVYPDAMRHLEYQHGQANGADIAGTGEYRIQCKRGRKYASLSKINEVQLCPIEGGIRVLVTKGDQTEAMACLPFSHFIELLRHEKRSRK